jgi:hypothetical protein
MKIKRAHMDIAKINELLIENEKIKAKIVEIKRKLNLKNYTQSQKQEFIKILKMLRDIIALNQEKCVTLSKIKAGKFANIVCRVLNKEYGYQYEVKTVALKYPYNSMRIAMARAYNNETSAAFLVVKSRKVKKNEEVSLNDKTLLPIAYLSGYYGDDCFDEYTDLLLEQQEISLFEYETLETLLFLLITFLFLFADQRTKAIAMPIRTAQQTVLYSIPENRGNPDIPCARPTVKGFNIAPANPTCAAT